MKLKYIYAILLIIIVAFSCKTSKKNIEASSYTAYDTVYTVSKGACYGKCPTYHIELRGDGFAKLKVVDNLELLAGDYVGQIDGRDLDRVTKLYSWTNIFNHKPEYKSNFTDLPTDTYTIKTSTHSHSVSGDALPREFSVLGEYIDDLIKKTEWEKTSTDSFQNEEAEEELSQFIVDLHHLTQFNEWINDYEEHGIIIEKTVSTREKIYLVSFENTSLDNGALYKLLDNDNRIESVDRNRRTSLR